MTKAKQLHFIPDRLSQCFVCETERGTYRVENIATGSHYEWQATIDYRPIGKTWKLLALAQDAADKHWRDCERIDQFNLFGKHNHNAAH